DKHFADSAFMNYDKLKSKLSSVLQYYRQATTKIEQKLINIVEISAEQEIIKQQEDNYLNFLLAIGKKIGPIEYNPPIYLRMGFGLIECYAEIIHNILKCIAEKQNKQIDL